MHTNPDMKIPGENEWRGWEENLDSQYSYKRFFGRSNESMQPDFKYNVVERSDDIRWMPKEAFQYYILGLRDFVMSDNHGWLQNSDAASCYMELVLSTLSTTPDFIRPIYKQLEKSLIYIAENQQEFEADEDIYGNFKLKLKEIEQLLTFPQI